MKKLEVQSHKGVRHANIDATFMIEMACIGWKSFCTGLLASLDLESSYFLSNSVRQCFN